MITLMHPVFKNINAHDLLLSAVKKKDLPFGQVYTERLVRNSIFDLEPGIYLYESDPSGLLVNKKFYSARAASIAVSGYISDPFRRSDQG